MARNRKMTDEEVIKVIEGGETSYAMVMDFTKDAGPIIPTTGGYSYQRAKQPETPLPCAECGSGAWITFVSDRMQHDIHCDSYDCSAPGFAHHDVGEVIAMWNRTQRGHKKPPRAPSSATEDDQMEAATMRMMREVVRDLGYEDVLEALEDLARAKKGLLGGGLVKKMQAEQEKANREAKLRIDRAYYVSGVGVSALTTWGHGETHTFNTGD